MHPGSLPIHDSLNQEDKHIQDMATHCPYKLAIQDDSNKLPENVRKWDAKFYVNRRNKLIEKMYKYIGIKLKELPCVKTITPATGTINAQIVIITATRYVE